MNRNCLLCGVGGQGVVLASKIIAHAAMNKGMEVRTSETIGMAQRGGSVVSHVRMGAEIHSPMIPKGEADVILAFEPAEAVRRLPYLKEDGIVIVNKKAVEPITATLSGDAYSGEEMIACLLEQVKGLYIVDGEQICRQAGSPKALNIALLGVACESGKLGIAKGDVEEEIKRCVKPQFIEMNIKALSLGMSVAKAK